MIPASVKAHRSKCLRRYGQLKSRKSIMVFDSPRSLSCTISCYASLPKGIEEKDGLPLPYEDACSPEASVALECSYGNAPECRRAHKAGFQVNDRSRANTYTPWASVARSC